MTTEGEKWVHTLCLWLFFYSGGLYFSGSLSGKEQQQWREAAAGLTESCYLMYALSPIGLSGDAMDMTRTAVTSMYQSYYMRPEAVEVRKKSLHKEKLFPSETRKPRDTDREKSKRDRGSRLATSMTKCHVSWIAAIPRRAMGTRSLHIIALYSPPRCQFASFLPPAIVSPPVSSTITQILLSLPCVQCAFCVVSSFTRARVISGHSF